MMAVAQCPHCGELNFTLGGWADLDRCASCGKSLARQHPRFAQSRVQEQLTVHDRGVVHNRQTGSKPEDR